MMYCVRCGATLEPDNSTGLCYLCAPDEQMLDDCDRDGRRETAEFEAVQRERRDYHER